MSRLTRTIRALILALMLPALLVPSGWSAHLCLCGVVASESALSCCGPEDAKLESDGACCSNERASLDPRAPVAGGGSDCDQSGCDGCCRIVEAAGFELVFDNPIQFELPEAPAALLVVAASMPPQRDRALRACARSLAPPRANTPLPLRI